MAQVAPRRPNKQMFTDGPTDRWMDQLMDSVGHPLIELFCRN